MSFHISGFLAARTLASPHGARRDARRVATRSVQAERVRERRAEDGETSSGLDFRDGAGLVHAEALFERCTEEGGGAVDGYEDLNLEEGGMEMPDGTSTYEPGVPRDEGYEPLSYVPGEDPNRVGEMLFATELVPGDRARFTVSWNSCLDLAPGGSARTTTDLDLVLYNADGGPIEPIGWAGRFWH